MIRKATPDDIDQIEKIYTAIHDAEESGTLTIGWLRGVYPVRQTAVDGIARGDMFVAEDGGDQSDDQPDPAAGVCKLPLGERRAGQ